MKLVLDASVALSWLLEDAGAGQAYAAQIFNELAEPAAEARVPVTWTLEIANVIAKCEGRQLLPVSRSQAFLAAVEAAPIVVDGETAARALTETLDLARRYGLSSYDASYLELALRSMLPLATLDRALQSAAQKAGVKLVKSS
ncbi:MAG: type II toxin-antitoxin system VapC family toxin [Gammaproteobacteria bacterium]|nr:type II toxin-antitoxin system VapC family toxin [Gammaproteobacteria bacterium]MBV8404617.1 type II toxin-antitoxin system VapC family toxin [Gammaproteobacteria bacterium]